MIKNIIRMKVPFLNQFQERTQLSETYQKTKYLLKNFMRCKKRNKNVDNKSQITFLGILKLF